MEIFRLITLLILGGDIIKGTKQKDEVLGPVENPTYNGFNDRILLHWKPPLNWRSPRSLHYIVTYKNMGKNLTFCRNTSLLVEMRTADSTTYCINNLEPFSKYEVNIYAEEIGTQTNRGPTKSLDTYTLGLDELSKNEFGGASIIITDTREGNITFKIRSIYCSKIQGTLILGIKIFNGNSNNLNAKHRFHSELLDSLTITYNASLEPSTHYNFEARLCRNDTCSVFYEGNFLSSSSNIERQKPHNIRDKWNINNTVQLFWDYDFNITLFEVLIIEEDFKINETFNYNASSHLYPTNFNFLVPKVFFPCWLISVQVIAINKTHRIQSEMFSTSSYPPSPDWNLNISSESDNSTITVKLNILPEKLFLSSRFLFILIQVQKPDVLDKKNVKNLEDILNTSFYESSKTRIVAKVDIVDKNITNLHYQIGNESFPQIFRSSNSFSLSHIEYNNRPLKKNHCYNVTILLINEFKGKYSFKNYFYSFKTTKNRVISHNEISWWIFVILILCVAVAIFVLYKKKKWPFTKKLLKLSVRFSTGITKNNIYTRSSCRNNEENSTVILTTNEYEEIQENDFNDLMANRINHKEVELKDYEEYVKRSIEDGELQKQHALFPRKLLHPCEIGKKSDNRLRNRYSNLIAYDHSRVKLTIKAENECSDYINANYINDNNEQKAYIATQGPLPQTIEDFWKMIWQERVKLIVMLANIYEDNKKRVEQYWPDKNGKKMFGNICIRYRSVQLFADYEYRIFSITCDGEMRQVHQIHFTSWPGQGIPLYSHTLVPIIKRMLKAAPSFDSPIVVHCSAGVGRTGTILLCDICMRMVKEKYVVDMFHTVRRLREQRPNMVDNDEQYKLAHLVVLDCLMGLTTEINCNSDFKYSVERILNNSEHKLQMHYLEENKWRDEAMKSVAKYSENILNDPEKNRIQTVVPGYQERIGLSKYPKYDEFSTYINAVWVDGYRSRKKFIVTQHPMPNTVGDFWRLVLEKQIRVVVSLNEVNFRNEATCRFWPNNEELKIEPMDYMSVKFDNVIDLGYCDVYSVIIVLREKEEEEIRIKIYSLKGWPAGSYLPPSCEDFLSLLEQTDVVSEESNHTIITCLDGVTASGIYVALSYIINKMKVEQMCDVCLSVRTVRHNREQFILNDDQYGFLYSAALNWMEQHKIS